MTSTQQATHRIQRLTLRSRIRDPSAAFALQRQLKEDWDKLLPIFEQQFDQLADTNQIVRIPRLELRLKVADIDELSMQLPAALLKALQAELHISDKNIADDNAPKKEPQQNIPLKPATESANPFNNESGQEALFHYLETGTLPWYTRDLSDAANRLRESVSHRSAKLDAWLLSRNSPDVFLRWLHLIDTLKSPLRLIDYIDPLLPDSTSEYPWHDFINAIVCDELSTHSNRQKLEILSVLLVATQRGSGNGKTPISIAPTSLGISPKQWRQWEDHFLKTGLPRTFISDIIRPVLIQAVNHQADDQEQSKRDVPMRSSDQQLSIQNKESVDLPAAAVQLAGCILLHPYLVRLFTACNIKHREREIHPKHLDRAAALLVFAARGDESALEFELELIKLLLGAAPHTKLLVTPGLLSRDDKAEVETLLGALITHWARLKNTSINGLRQTFLQRSGWLKTEQTGLQLHIDRSGPDVLINFLPFSISMVTLPWMPKPLHVNW